MYEVNFEIRNLVYQIFSCHNLLEFAIVPEAMNYFLKIVDRFPADDGQILAVLHFWGSGLGNNFELNLDDLKSFFLFAFGPVCGELHSRVSLFHCVFVSSFFRSHPDSLLNFKKIVENSAILMQCGEKIRQEERLKESWQKYCECQKFWEEKCPQACLEQNQPFAFQKSRLVDYIRIKPSPIYLSPMLPFLIRFTLDAHFCLNRVQINFSIQNFFCSFSPKSKQCSIHLPNEFLFDLQPVILVEIVMDSDRVSFTYPAQIVQL